MIVGVSGLAGSGKSVVADYLHNNYGFVTVNLADPIKRYARDAFDFSEEKLWGASHLRNEPDTRYVREVYDRHDWTPSRDSSWKCARCGTGEADNTLECKVYLTPRHVLQQFGTELGRSCYKNVWVDLALRTAKRLLQRPAEAVGAITSYTPQRGVFLEYAIDPEKRPARGVVIPDCRFRNEVDAFRASGARLIRLKRMGAGLQGSAGLHPSEQEQLSIPDIDFDAVIENNASIEDLKRNIDHFLKIFGDT